MLSKCSRADWKMTNSIIWLTLDDLFRIKGASITDKKLVVFHSVLAFLFWGGAVFLCMYFFPHIWPEARLASILVGPP
jgi:hypothetical protein